MLRTLFFIVTFTPWTLVVLLASLPLSILGPDALHHWARVWARIGLLLAGVRVRCQGAEFRHDNRPLVYMPNHQSNFDILALLLCLRKPFRWVAKKELFAIPLFGTAMRLAGCIAIDRSDHEQARSSLDEAVRRIGAGEAVMIFPEGTRSVDGRLLPFKKGGFMTALKAQATIIPIVIDGSARVLPKQGRLLTPGTISITFLPGVETRGMSLDERDTLMDRVRECLQTQLEKQEPATS